MFSHLSSRFLEGSLAHFQDSKGTIIGYVVAAKVVSNARHFPFRDKTVSAIIQVVNRVRVDIPDLIDRENQLLPMLYLWCDPFDR